MVVWKMPVAGRLYVCRVTELRDADCDVHYFGTYSKGPLHKRQFRPACVCEVDGRSVHQAEQPLRSSPEIVAVRREWLVASNVTMHPARLPEHIVSLSEDGVDGCVFHLCACGSLWCRAPPEKKEAMGVSFTCPVLPPAIFAMTTHSMLDKRASLWMR